MSIRDELRADAEEQQRRGMAGRCKTCRLVEGLEPAEAIEWQDIMPDRSFQDASIARWLGKRFDTRLSKESVAKHRRAHL